MMEIMTTKINDDDHDQQDGAQIQQENLCDMEYTSYAILSPQIILQSLHS